MYFLKIKTLAVFFSLIAMSYTGYIKADEVDATNVTDFSNDSHADADYLLSKSY